MADLDPQIYRAITRELSLFPEGHNVRAIASNLNMRFKYRLSDLLGKNAAHFGAGEIEDSYNEKDVEIALKRMSARGEAEPIAPLWDYGPGTWYRLT